MTALFRPRAEERRRVHRALGHTPNLCQEKRNIFIRKRRHAAVIDLTPRGRSACRRHPERLDAALSALFLLLWPGGFPAVKIGLEAAPPLTFLALRYAGLAALLAPLQLGFRLPLPRARRNWPDPGVIGVSIQFVYFSGAYLAMRFGLPAGAAALIVSLQPVLVGILSPLWAGEPVSRRQWFGLAPGFIGAGSVILAKSRVEAASWAGTGFALAALLGITPGLLYEKKTSAPVHPIVSTLTQTGGALVLLPPCILLFEGAARESGAIQWGAGWDFPSPILSPAIRRSRSFSYSIWRGAVRR